MPHLARTAANWMVLGCSLLLAVAGCGGSGKHFDDRDWTKDHGIQTGAWREVSNLFSAQESDVDKYNATPRGVRHDLTFSTHAEAATHCNCLDVVIGAPTDPQFRWAGVRPKISQKHLAVAIRTDGSKCSLPNGTARRPSIQAVDLVGDDVIVVIEELDYDRPQAMGAVIQKPGADGKLLVRPRRYKNRVLPYARGLDKNNRCVVRTDKREHHLNVRSGRHF